MADSRIPDDVLDAVYQFVHRHKAEWLSKKTGTPAGTIWNKANPHDTSHHKPTLSDVLIWSQIAGDYSIVQALCRALGGVFVSLHTLAETSDLELLDLVLKREKEDGEFADVLAKALGDGNIDQEDFRKLRTEAYDVITAVLELLSRLEGMIRD